MSWGDGRETEVGEELRGWMEGRDKYGGGLGGCRPCSPDTFLNWS